MARHTEVDSLESLDAIRHPEPIAFSLHRAVPDTLRPGCPQWLGTSAQAGDALRRGAGPGGELWDAELLRSQATGEGPDGGCLERPCVMKMQWVQGVESHLETPGSPFLHARRLPFHCYTLKMPSENQQK